MFCFNTIPKVKVVVSGLGLFSCNIKYVLHFLNVFLMKGFLSEARLLKVIALKLNSGYPITTLKLYIPEL